MWINAAFIIAPCFFQSHLVSYAGIASPQMEAGHLRSHFSPGGSVEELSEACKNCLTRFLKHEINFRVTFRQCFPSHAIGYSESIGVV